MRERWFGLVQAYMQRYPAVEVRQREAMTEQLQDQLLAGQLDGVLGLAPSRVAGLTYTHVHDETALGLAALRAPAGGPGAARTG